MRPLHKKTGLGGFELMILQVYNREKKKKKDNTIIMKVFEMYNDISTITNLAKS